MINQSLTTVQRQLQRMLDQREVASMFGSSSRIAQQENALIQTAASILDEAITREKDMLKLLEAYASPRPIPPARGGATAALTPARRPTRAADGAARQGAPLADPARQRPHRLLPPASAALGQRGHAHHPVVGRPGRARRDARRA